MIVGIIITEIAERTDWFSTAGTTLWNAMAAHPIETVAICGMLFICGFVANKIIK